MGRRLLGVPASEWTHPLQIFVSSHCVRGSVLGTGDMPARAKPWVSSCPPAAFREAWEPFCSSKSVRTSTIPVVGGGRCSLRWLRRGVQLGPGSSWDLKGQAER